MKYTVICSPGNCNFFSLGGEALDGSEIPLTGDVVRDGYGHEYDVVQRKWNHYTRTVDLKVEKK